ncbi:VOC family protein [Rhodococcus sp. NPDC003348]
MTDIHSLGYLRVQSQDLARWRELVIDGLGMAEGTGPDENGLYLRVDERTSRLQVLPGDVDKVLAVGWEVRDQFALQAVREKVEKAGIEVREMTQDEADHLRVERAITFQDPSGTVAEVFFGPVLDHSPVVTPHGGRFVTGAAGLGHVVLPTPKFQETYDFFTEVLGFRPRGAIRLGGPGSPGPARRVRFLGVNQRHHSLAICPAPPTEAPGMVHLMMEVDTLDAVGQALDRINKLGFSLSSTLGRHTNDKMVSFYVRAPGGWDIEFGTEGMLVDEDHYTAEEITADSYWGHDWSASEPLAAFTPKA